MQANTNELVAVLSEGESQNESEFVLKARHNNLTVKEPCAICGFVDDFADWPYWIFLDGRYDSAVCHMCIEKHDPILLELVNYANLYRWQELS